MKNQVKSLRHQVTWQNVRFVARIAINFFCRVLGCFMLPILIFLLWIAVNVELDALQGLSLRTAVVMMNAPLEDRAFARARGLMIMSGGSLSAVSGSLPNKNAIWNPDLCFHAPIFGDESTCYAYASGKWNTSVRSKLNASRKVLLSHECPLGLGKFCSLRELQNVSSESTTATTCNLISPKQLLLASFQAFRCRASGATKDPLVVVIHGDERDLQLWTDLISAFRGVGIKRQNFASVGQQQQGTGILAYAATVVGDLITATGDIKPLESLLESATTSGVLLLAIYVPADLPLLDNAFIRLFKSDDEQHKMLLVKKQASEMRKIFFRNAVADRFSSFTYNWMDKFVEENCVEGGSGRKLSCSSVSRGNAEAQLLLSDLCQQLTLN